MRLPEKGLAREVLLERLGAYAAADVPSLDGRMWAYVYYPGQEAYEVGKQAYMRFLAPNMLDFTIYPSTVQLERDLVSMAAAHVGGDVQVVGNFTSGGTESCMLAVKTARDCYRTRRPEIQTPEVILPASAHAAFHKAAHYFGLKVIQTALDPNTLRADPEAVRRAITPNTIMLVGSAPSYPHGVVDPIPALGQIALDRGLWLHCDACVGGFMLPYLRRLGVAVPDFDFGVPGVTSLSMDLHKYGYTPKGASVVLYRNRELRKYQLFAFSGWPGYTVVNNTMQSSKTAGPVAAAWSVVQFIGDDGYLELARRSYEATQRLIAGIEAIPGLCLIARPDMFLFAFTSDTISVFHIIDEMRERRWVIQPQFAFGALKENIHLTVSASNTPWVDAFLADLRQCAERAATMESGRHAAMVREFLSSLDPAAPVEGAFGRMLEALGVQGSVLPSRMAAMNEMLNALPADLRDLALTSYLNDVFS
jgi:glutamate/tyrosine decarboxylase-like PLP-dependent enzyme